MEAVLAQEGEHPVVRRQPALVGDVVADQRDAVVAGEQQGAVVLLEEADVRVVLDEGGQAGGSEQFPGDLGAGGEEAADLDGERGLVAEDARVGGAVQGGGVQGRGGHPGAFGDQGPPLLAEDLPGGHQLDRVVPHGTPAATPASITSLRNGG
nr:hypothetical protein GCM10020093_035680 [Planobispora longispora]